MAHDEDGAGAASRFTEFYRCHHPPVTAYVDRRCADRELASQVVEETFTVAWRRLDEAVAGGAPWLFRTARLSLNNAVRAERRQVRAARRQAAADVRSRDGGDTAEPLADLLHVREVLATLSQRDQEVLMLTYWEDLPAKQLGATLGCAAGTAAVRLHRARNRFRKALLNADAGTPDDPLTTTGRPEESLS